MASIVYPLVDDAMASTVQMLDKIYLKSKIYLMSKINTNTLIVLVFIEISLFSYTLFVI